MDCGEGEQRKSTKTEVNARPNCPSLKSVSLSLLKKHTSLTGFGHLREHRFVISRVLGSMLKLSIEDCGLADELLRLCSYMVSSCQNYCKAQLIGQRLVLGLRIRRRCVSQPAICGFMRFCTILFEVSWAVV